MELSSVSEVNSFPSTQKILHILWNQNHNPQLFPTLNQINPIHTHSFFCFGDILILSSHSAYSSK